MDTKNYGGRGEIKQNASLNKNNALSVSNEPSIKTILSSTYLMLLSYMLMSSS